jgi:S1-C subfamily serine protease
MKCMLRLAAVSFAFFLTFSALADYVTAEILTRVLLIRNGSIQGTCFSIEVDDRQYLATAKHLFPGTNENAVIEIYHSKKWEQLPVSVLRSVEADVAVLIPPVVLTPTMKISLTNNAGMFLGEDVYFLGFPYGLSTDNTGDINNGFPIAFLKKGIISAWRNGTNKYSTTFVDGMNNPGFSGGPLFIGTKSPTETVKVLAIISGYRINPDRVINNDIDTGLRSAANSGIIECPNIQYAMDEIKKHPTGPKITN